MSEGAVKRVVIAGGGTAGWVTAAALVRHLGPLLDITLVESDEIGTVGVGESTIPTSRRFHQLLGIDEPTFMRETQASFKLGIAFENWAQEGDRYFHAFGQIGRTGSWMADFHHFWLQARDQGFGGSLDDYCLELQAARAERAMGPKLTVTVIQGEIGRRRHGSSVLADFRLAGADLSPSDLGASIAVHGTDRAVELRVDARVRRTLRRGIWRATATLPADALPLLSTAGPLTAHLEVRARGRSGRGAFPAVPAPTTAMR